MCILGSASSCLSGHWEGSTLRGNTGPSVPLPLCCCLLSPISNEGDWQGRDVGWDDDPLELSTSSSPEPVIMLVYKALWAELCSLSKKYVEVRTPNILDVTILDNRVTAQVTS